MISKNRVSKSRRLQPRFTTVGTVHEVCILRAGLIISEGFTGCRAGAFDYITDAVA
jgi:hypothetical protein